MIGEFLWDPCPSYSINGPPVPKRKESVKHGPGWNILVIRPSDIKQLIITDESRKLLLPPTASFLFSYED